MIYLDKVILSNDMIEAAKNAFLSEPLLFGESIKKFEEEFARYCGVDFAITVASGTDALTFSLMAAGVKGKHVLTTPSSYIATANVAFHAGGTPVFCDIDPETNNIAAAEIKKTITKDKKIKAILPVHLHGYPADMNEIMELAEKKDIFVLEDACQAHGASYFGKKAGALGHAAGFSFNPMKNITVGGEGGMVTTNDEKIAKKVRMLADSGRETPYTHEHAIIGYSSRISTVSAVIGRMQLQNLDRWNEHRRWAADEYRYLLNDLGSAGLELCAPETQDIKPAYNKYTIRTKNRDGLKKYLYDNGVETDSHFPIPIHFQPPYKALGYKKGDYPQAERFANTTLSLPMFVDITKEEIDIVANAVKAFFSR